MTRNHSCHLLNMLAEVPDPRKKKGRRHPLAARLALTGVGLLCGQRSYTQIAKWARLYPALRNALGFTAKQTPAAATFHYLYRRLDIDAVEKMLTQWTTQTLASSQISTSDLKGLAIDGKTLGNSHTQDVRRFENLHAEVSDAHLQTYTDTQDAKGRITTRTLTASPLLTEHTDWPELQQVYQYTTHQKCKKTGQVKCHVQ